MNHVKTDKQLSEIKAAQPVTTGSKHEAEKEKRKKTELIKEEKISKGYQTWMKKREGETKKP